MSSHFLSLKALNTLRLLPFFWNHGLRIFPINDGPITENPRDNSRTILGELIFLDQKYVECTIMITLAYNHRIDSVEMKPKGTSKQVKITYSIIQYPSKKKRYPIPIFSPNV